MAIHHLLLPPLFSAGYNLKCACVSISLRPSETHVLSYYSLIMSEPRANPRHTHIFPYSMFCIRARMRVEKFFERWDSCRRYIWHSENRLPLWLFSFIVFALKIYRFGLLFKKSEYHPFRLLASSDGCESDHWRSVRWSIHTVCYWKNSKWNDSHVNLIGCHGGTLFSPGISTC